MAIPTKPFFGLRGTGDWVTDQRPKNWREQMLFLSPNGMASLTALTSQMKNRKVDDPEYNWWTKKTALQASHLNGIFTDAGLLSAYTGNASAGTTLYVRLRNDLSVAPIQNADENQKNYRVGMQVNLTKIETLSVIGNHANDVTAKITAQPAGSGASSYLTINLLQSDPQTDATGLAAATYVLVTGNINEEGAERPRSVVYDPTKYFNYTQIFRTPLEITRTAKLTRLRTQSAYEEAKREALEYHMIEMERAFLFGIKTENTGTDGKPERTTQGFVNFIKENCPNNIQDFANHTGEFDGETWTNAGLDFLDKYFEELFRFGDTEKLAYVGSLAMQAINKSILDHGSTRYQINAETRGFGIRVVNLITPFGEVAMKTHPLLTQSDDSRRRMIILEPKQLSYNFITDTMFKTDNLKEGGANSADALKEEYLTEAGLSYDLPDTGMVLDNIGRDNTP